MRSVAPRLRSLLVAMALASALADATCAIAQSSQQAYDPSDVRKRIERSGDLQRQALRTLGDPVRAEELVRKAYDELQAAQNALVIYASGQKFRDPLLDINTRKSQEALSLLQRAADALRTNQGSSPGQADQEEANPPQTPAGSMVHPDVRTNLEQALRLTSTLMVL